ncbi:MAG: hypothetical protein JSW14_02780 [Candidatus Bathyarchaeum sp.]|nr:MAG: hypothetical protein JSW14_02780 [Candidatus Bathyarchaeum sp.]
MRIVACSEKQAKNESKLNLYTNYAHVVFHSFSKPIFQNFLNWIFRIEKMEKSMVKDIQIRFFPFIKENGNGLVGKCNNRGVVFLYPEKYVSTQKKMKKLGLLEFKIYIKWRAIAALIHELLHFKYKGNEARVKELTKKYFNIYYNNQFSKQSDTTYIPKMIFDY